MFIYKTKGVCSTEIHVDVENDTIKSVEFIKGCPGNLFGIASLVKGMKVEEAIDKLKGIKCGAKDTSCPDQLSKALEELKLRA
ncbi:TIGR03905 family TSCPD domain-containing protein [Clostridium carnis]